ncbi:MAG: hypothetical protein H7Y42_15075 [Chitinophagaceae bacterium]|nr:hypothetical protein [Chitinophagaceae bacterium]
MLRKAIFHLTLLIILSMVVACSSDNKEETFYTRIGEATLHAGDTLPAPTGDVILTVTGKVGITNVDDTIQMDIAMIEAAGQFEYEVTDPFESVDRVYGGPLMSDLLALWQVPDDATQIEITALDDYVVTVSIKDLRDYPVLFALQQDGEYMPVATRGPAMLVFPYNNFEFEEQIYNDFWAWQIKSINVQ